MSSMLEHTIATKQPSLYAHQVASLMGGDANPEQVDEVVRRLREEKYLVHGVKTNKDFSSVDSTGVERKTPEGGQASFWNSGNATFGSGTATGTYNTAFFHYGHSADLNNTDNSYMTLVLTRRPDLEDILPREDTFQDDAELTLHAVVPRDRIHVLRVEVDHKGKSHSRELGQRIEQEMFKLLYETLQSGYTRGAKTIKKLVA